MATRSASAAAALLAVLALAGCGGSGGSGGTLKHAQTPAAKAPVARQHLAKQAYVERMQQLGHRLGLIVEGIYPIDTGTAHSQTSKDTIAKLRKARVKVDAVLADLQRIDPPAPVLRAHRQIERGVRGMEIEMQQVVAALEKGDLPAAMEPSAMLSLRTVVAATDSMERAGYDVLARHVRTTAG